METKAEKIINEPAPPKAILDEIKTAPVNTFAELEAFVPESEDTKVYLALVKPVLSAMKEKVRLGIEVTEEDKKGLIYTEVEVANKIDALLAKEKEIAKREKIDWAQTYDDLAPEGLGKTAVDLESKYLAKKLAPAQATDPADYEAKELVMEWWREDAKRLAADPNYRHYYSKAEIGSKDYFDYQLAKAKEQMEADKKARALVLQGYNADKKEVPAAQTAPEAFVPFGGEELSSAEYFAHPTEQAEKALEQKGDIGGQSDECKLGDDMKDENKFGHISPGKIDDLADGSNDKVHDRVLDIRLEGPEKITFAGANASMTTEMIAWNASLPGSEQFNGKNDEAVSDADSRKSLCGTEQILAGKIESLVVRQTGTAPTPGGLEAEMMERKARLEAFMTREQARKYEDKKTEVIAKNKELAMIEAEINESYRGSLSKTFKRASKAAVYERLNTKRYNLQAELAEADAELIRMNLYAHLDLELGRSYKKAESFRSKMRLFDKMTQKWKDHSKTRLGISG